MVKTMKTTSVIIVTYHTGAILQRSIEAILRQEGLKELIIVNNGNPKAVEEKLQQMRTQNKNIKYISGHGNIGFSKACNLAAKEAKGDYILLLNPDCLLQRGSLAKTMEEMEKHKDVWVAGCQMIRPNGSLQGGSKRNLLTPNVAFSQSLGFYNLGGYFKAINISETIGELKDSAPSVVVPAISGAFMMFPKERYKQLGGLDEDYFFHVEDLDMCYRVNRDGGKVLYVPTVKATHFASSSQVSSAFVEKNKAEGFLTYFRKHSELSSPVLYVFIVMGIYLRLWLRIPALWVKEILYKRRQKSLRIKSLRQINLLHSAVEKEALFSKKPKEVEPVLLAGSTGQVGLGIMRRLLANKIKTYGLYHEQVVDYTHSDLEWIQADLESNHIGINGDILKKNPPRTLIHTPAIWYLSNKIKFFADMGIKRIICFSSTSIEGKSKSQNPYEKEVVEKFITAEKELLKKGRELGIDITIFRPTMIYGFGIDRNVTSIVKFIDSFGFFPVSIPANGYRMPVHADDLAKAVMSVLGNKKSYGRVYNLCGNTKLTYFEMVKEIFITLKRPQRIYRLPMLSGMLDVFSFLTGNKDTNGEVAKRMNQDLAFSDKSAREDFGYRPRDFLSAGKVDLGL